MLIQGFFHYPALLNIVRIGKSMLIQGFFNYPALLNRIRIGKSMLYQGFSMNWATPGNYIKERPGVKTETLSLKN